MKTNMPSERYIDLLALFVSPLGNFFFWWGEVLSAIKLSFIATYDNVQKAITDNDFHFLLIKKHC